MKDEGERKKRRVLEVEKGAGVLGETSNA